MKKKHNLIMFLLLLTQYVWSQNWTAVGPFSTNLASGNLFETGRAECIAVDPTNTAKIYVGAMGGLWKTTNGGANWYSMDPDPMYYSGASAVTVSSAGKLYVASTELSGRKTKGIYTFDGTNWSGLLSLPAGGKTFVINHLQFFPGSTTLLFACTSIGIFRSTDGGVTWGSGPVATATEEYENITFIPGTNLCYATGGNKINASDPKVFKESTDQGLTFTTVTAVTSLFTQTYGYADLCLGDVSTVNKEVYILASMYTTASNDAQATYKVLKMIKNTSTGAITCTSYYTFADYDNSQDRLAIAYTPNKRLFVGGVYLYGLDVSTATPTSLSVSLMHTDQHDLIAVPSLNKVFSASDGGFSVADYTATSINLVRTNNGLNISQIHGFSGSATTTDFYVTGEQDTKGFVYNATSKLAINTWGTEPSGGLIDKFNDNRIFVNGDSYGPGYQISTDHGVTFPAGGDATHPPVNGEGVNYLPVTNQNTFEAGTTAATEAYSFGTHNFYQDPGRPDKIYSATGNLNLYDPLHNAFAIKMRMGVIFSDCSNPVRCCNFFAQGLSVAISPVDKNGLYLTTMNRPMDPSASQVIRYIGPDIDNSWLDHNEDLTNWQLITPDLTAAPFSLTLSATDIYSIVYTSVVISQTDKDKAWVGVSGVPGHPEIKVLFYNHGVWSNYSQNLPDEPVSSMVAEAGSNDGIYLSTDRSIYYSNGFTKTWISYSTNLPHLRSPQMEINYKENTVRAGTYGQGIWKTNLQCPSGPLAKTNCSNCNSLTDYYWEGTSVTISNTQLNQYPVTMRGADYVDLLPASGYTQLDPTVVSGNSYTIYIHGCGATQGNSFRQIATGGSDYLTEASKALENANYLTAFPNPSKGLITLKMGADENEEEEMEVKQIYVYDLLGNLVLKKENVRTATEELDLTGKPKGIYLIKVLTDDACYTRKIIIN